MQQNGGIGHHLYHLIVYGYGKQQSKDSAYAGEPQEKIIAEKK